MGTRSARPPAGRRRDGGISILNGLRSNDRIYVKAFSNDPTLIMKGEFLYFLPSWVYSVLSSSQNHRQFAARKPSRFVGSSQPIDYYLTGTKLFTLQSTAKPKLKGNKTSMKIYSLILITLFTTSAFAVSPQFWEENSQQTFTGGDPQSISIDSNGELLLAPALKKLYEGKDPLFGKFLEIHQEIFMPPPEMTGKSSRLISQENKPFCSIRMNWKFRLWL